MLSLFKTDIMDGTSPVSVPSVGIKDIDDQHKQLIDHLERLVYWIDRGHGFSASLDALGQIQQYVSSHFAFEEAFLRNHKYPKIDDHVAQHLAFKADLDRLTEMVIAGNDASEELLHTLVRWIKTHIGEEDLEYGQYFGKATVASD